MLLDGSGGLALTAGYESLGVTLGLLTIIAALVILILAKEPCKTMENNLLAAHTQYT